MSAARQKPGASGGGGGGNEDAAFSSFLSELTEAVGEKFELLHGALPTAPDPVFTNDAKTVRDWPEISGLIIEELR